MAGSTHARQSEASAPGAVTPIRKQPCSLVSEPLIFTALLAQAQQSTSQGGGGFELLFFIGLMVIVFYLLILRPSRKEQKKREEMIKSVTKGAKVVTAGGIHGTVTDVSDPVTVTMEIAKNTKIKINRSSLSVIQSDDDKEKEADKGKDKKGEGPVEKS